MLCLRDGLQPQSSAEALPMNHSSQIRMTNDEIRRNDKILRTRPANAPPERLSTFGLRISFVIRHSSFNDSCESGSSSQRMRKSEWRLSMNLDIGARLCAQHQPQHAGNIQSAAAGSSTTAALQEIRPGSWSQCMRKKNERRLSMNLGAPASLPACCPGESRRPGCRRSQSRLAG